MKNWGIVLIVGILLTVADGYYRAGRISADAPQSTTKFFTTYDPDPVIRQFGKDGQRSGSQGRSSGWREATRTRDLTVTVEELPPSRVAGLTAALRSDIETKLQATTHIRGTQESSGETSYEYESPHAWGMVILERIEPDSARSCDDTHRWQLRMRMVERWRNS